MKTCGKQLQTPCPCQRCPHHVFSDFNSFFANYCFHHPSKVILQLGNTCPCALLLMLLDLHVQFAIDDSMFLLSKCHILTNWIFLVLVNIILQQVEYFFMLAAICFMGSLLKKLCIRWRCMVWCSMQQLSCFQIFKKTFRATITKGCEGSIHI